MATLTITEALADLKTIGKRVQKKVEFIGSNFARNEGMKDPLEKDGGSPEVVRRERQAILDLQRRHISIRVAIQQVNHATPMTVLGVTRTIAEWLTWRKEVAPGEQSFLKSCSVSIQKFRTQAQSKGVQVIGAGNAVNATNPSPLDIIVNMDESQLAKDIEALENILGTLDGQLSLKNATTMITIPD